MRWFYYGNQCLLSIPARFYSGVLNDRQWDIKLVNELCRLLARSCATLDSMYFVSSVVHGLTIGSISQPQQQAMVGAGGLLAGAGSDAPWRESC